MATNPQTRQSNHASTSDSDVSSQPKSMRGPSLPGFSKHKQSLLAKNGPRTSKSASSGIEVTGTNTVVGDAAVAVKSVGWAMMSNIGYNRASATGLGAEGREGMSTALQPVPKTKERAGVGHHHAAASPSSTGVAKKSAEQKQKERLVKRGETKEKSKAKKKRDELLFKAMFDSNHLDLSGL